MFFPFLCIRSRLDISFITSTSLPPHCVSLPVNSKVWDLRNGSLHLFALYSNLCILLGIKKCQMDIFLPFHFVCE